MYHEKEELYHLNILTKLLNIKNLKMNNKKHTKKKCFIVRPNHLLSSEYIINKLQNQFPELLNYQWQTTSFLDGKLSFVNAGDIVIVEDDTIYTVSSLLEICEKTENSIIVLKQDNDDSIAFVSMMIKKCNYFGVV